VARVEFPSWWLSTGSGVPEVCARHGEPAIKRVNTTMSSRPPWWTYLLGGGLLAFLVVSVTGHTRKAVSVSGWPLCARCRTRQIITLGVGLLAIAAGLAAFVVGLRAGQAAYLADSTTNSTWWLWVLLGGLAVALAGVFVALHARAQGTAGAAVSRDGGAVVVRRSHERFAARAAALAVAERERIRARSLFPDRAA
jgi:hypothetical protein